ncbi:hypothetical protein JIG36_14470 [Actinoplanes sp. LDG1-06]|uniref:Uncharacterized protein n=1 Tax=Paractinoplanes ovalisporus TaxID=2810368 RepID=A0ABS2AA92_9ACTN|nr:hypothetical protein [Actinoplanes ovalisporus]MBM2616764.1 hypothetical protein [Actinoplanes ovalisporus]
MAAYLLYGVAAIQVINAILTLSISSSLTDAVRDAYAGTEAEGAEAFVSVAFIGGAVINLLLGVGFAVLGYFDSRGRNASRIVTWVIGGISLCCLGASLGSTALVGSVNSGSTTSGPSQDEVQRRLEDAMPSWYTPATTTLAVVGLLAILVVVILLALPAANDFFRKPAAAAWDPSVPYPSYPGQPPYPGQQPPPYPGQQPPYPGAGYGPGPGGPGPGGPGAGGPGAGYGPGLQGQPGQPAPGLPPYPGSPAAPPPASDPFAPPPSSTPPPSTPPPATPPPSAPPASGEQPPRPPADPA